MSSSNYKSCAFCDKSNATQICTGCNGAPDPTITSHVKTLYCSASCQKGHWNAHKQDCKAHQARRVLYRASETAQKAFYLFREFTYEQNIESVAGKGGSLFLHEGRYIDDRIFYPFPHHLLPQERDKQAALTYLTCGEAIAYMHGLLRTMLKGTSTHIIEMEIEVRPPQRPVRMIRPMGPDDKNYSHEVLRVTLKSGEEYVIDVTGAQHGFHKSLYPWHQYQQIRIKDVKRVLAFGTSSAKYSGAEWGLEPGYRGSIRRATKEVAVVFDRAVGEWEGKGITVGEMIRMNDEAFETTRGEMMGYVGGVMQEHLARSEREGKLMGGTGGDELEGILRNKGFHV